MKKLLGAAFLLLLVASLAPLAMNSAAASGNASVDCDFVRSGRGVCTAQPQGAGYSYSWWASGAAVANRNWPQTSAACGGTYGTIYVTVTDANGNSSTASTNASCP